MDVGTMKSGSHSQQDDQQDNQIEELASKVIGLARNSIMVNMRFMDAALGRLRLKSCPGTGCISVDGRFIRYDPAFILRQYRDETGMAARMYLHTVLHCIFLHFFPDKTADAGLWNLACDMAVENVINELGLPATDIKNASLQIPELAGIRRKVRYMNGEFIYRFLKSADLPPEELTRLERLFCICDHSAWYKTERRNVENNAPDSERDNDELIGKDEEQSGSDSGEYFAEGEEEIWSYDPFDKSREDGQKLEISWKNIAKSMQVDLETFSRERAEGAGALTQSLQAVNREKYNYSTFLRKFAVQGETLKINNDEFDYVFYTYGLKLYKKMPLIEPLEYKETNRIKEFVIAIDTSGSTSKTLVQNFVQKTYNILMQQESFFQRINLHIIQCDAEVQEDKKIESRRDFEDYLKTMTVRGLGGTDFRPVFNYVDELKRAGEFRDLKGLIYFTDGLGVFPARQPDYRVAVVYIDEGYAMPEVPVWAIRLVLRPEEI